MSGTLDTCSLCKDCTPLKVHADRGFFYPSNRSSKRRIMLVGEAPGQTEYTDGLPFRGRAGLLLSDALTAVYALLGLNGIGVVREQMVITNAVKCWPHRVTRHKKIKATKTTEESYVPQFRNLTPTKEMIENCRGWLWNDIVHYKPKLIIALGKTAEKSLRMLRDEQADIIDEMGIEFAHVWHPAYVLRRGGAKSETYWKWVGQLKEAMVETCQPFG